MTGDDPTSAQLPPAGWHPDPDGKKQELDAVIVVGYVFAVLAPLVGFAIGLTQINRHREGLWIVIVSVFMSLVWMVVFGTLLWG